MKCNHVISSYANFLGKKHFYILLCLIRIFSIHNMVAVSLFWDTNMAAVTSCDNGAMAPTQNVRIQLISVDYDYNAP